MRKADDFYCDWRIKGKVFDLDLKFTAIGEDSASKNFGPISIIIQTFKLNPNYGFDVLRSCIKYITNLYPGFRTY